MKPMTFSRRQFLRFSAVALAGVALDARSFASARKGGWLGTPLETDPDSGSETYQLVDDERPTDDIYGEQPYSPPAGNRIAVEHFSTDKLSGGLSILDLTDGSRHVILDSQPRFPAFHAWGDYLYYQEIAGDRLLLKRCHYQKLVKEDVAELPTAQGKFSYGTVSPNHRYYAASVHPKGGASMVFLMDLKTGRNRILAQLPEYHFKHEQFSRDGRNRVLIQANKLPDVKEVRLGALEVDREGIRWFPADRPHTPRPTGHEAWIGRSERILFSTNSDKRSLGNVWTAALEDAAPALVTQTPLRFGHVSVSRCGRYWIGDAVMENGIPIHVGSLKSGRHRRLVFSRTRIDGKQQWTHPHPYLTADNRWLIFNSTRSGHAQVYGARVPKGFLESL
jgi:Tol biopolymer transport system component